MGRRDSALHRWQTDLSVEKKAAVDYVSVVREGRERTRGNTRQQVPKSLRRAITLFREALALDSNYSRARENLAAAYIAIGQYSKAEQVLARMSSRASARGRFAVLRGILYAEEGKYARAGTAFRYAAKQKSTRRAAMYNLARLYEQARFTEKARGFYKEYLENYPRGPWASAAKRALKRI